MANVTAVAGEKEKVVLGAVDIYLADYSDGDTLDLDAMTATEANFFGNTQGGATLEYAPETYTVEDDKGRVRRNLSIWLAITRSFFLWRSPSALTRCS